MSTSLQYSFEGMDEQKAKGETEKTPIIHVYGRLALPESAESGERQTLPYGKDISKPSSIDLSAMAENVYVVHEERRNPELEKARTAVSDAERIIFLGFGYAKENLEALGLSNALKPDLDLRGTAMGQTKNEIKQITHHFTEALRRAGEIVSPYQVQIQDCDCVQLLRNFL